MPLAVRLVTMIVCGVLLAPIAAYAQATIAGTVKDSSGAVLPGVTVEAASPALIEKVRSTVTDGSGQYRIIELVPGVYTVTFTLPSFSTVKRDGIELGGTFTATIDVELRPGAVSETIVVSSEAPVVDVQSPRRQQVMDRDVITSLPVARTFFGIAALTPGINVALNAQDGGGINAPQVNSYSAYGGRLGEGRLLVDGVSVGGSAGGSGTGYYTADVGNAQEVSLTISGGLGESETGGPVLNVIPRTGGNTLRGQFYYNYANSNLQSDNRTDEILAANPTLRQQDEIIKFQEINGAFGGPIRQDRLWYYWSGRIQDNDQYAQNIWFNKNAGDPTSWHYEPDFDRPGISERNFRNTSLRLTVQATEKQKLNIFWDEQSNRAHHNGGGVGTGGIFGNSSPEASATSNGSPQRVMQATWQSPRSNRLLLEARANRTYTKYGNYERDTNPRLIRVTETIQELGTTSLSSLSYRSQQATYTLGDSPRWEAMASYVTGTHNIRIGYQGFMTLNEPEEFNTWNDRQLAYTFTRGVPSRVTQYLVNYSIEQSRVMTQAFYAQDTWTFRRLSLGGALRFDYAKSWFEDYEIGPSAYLSQPYFFEGGNSVRGFKDISPRASVAFDLFGNGKTALKGNIGRYLEAATNGGRYTAQHPFNRLSPSTSRVWTDANGNYEVDCNLNIYNQTQDLRSSGGDFCGIPTNTEFGNLSQPTSIYDETLLGGWGIRPNDWQFGVAVQQQLLPRVSVELAYNRRHYGLAPIINDNLNVDNSDYLNYTLVGPVDDRIGPASGRVLSDLYALSQAARLRGTLNITRAPTDEETRTNYWHGFDINANARMRGGFTLRGGVSVGREITDTCNQLFDNPSRRNCHIVEPFQPRISALGVYTVPVVDVQLSATYLSRPGAARAVNVIVPVAETGLPTGTFTATTVTTNFLDTGEMYGERVDEFDFKVAKVLRFMGRRATAGFEVFNVFNNDDILTYNNTYSRTGTNNWGQPTGIQPPRYARFSLQVDF